jgi:hypothetical protein
MSDETTPPVSEPVNGNLASPNALFMGLVKHCHDHLGVLVNGLSVAMATYPKEVQVAALAAACGEVLSQASLLSNIQHTLALRAKIRGMFKQALAQYAPAIQPGGPLATMPPVPPANRN